MSQPDRSKLPICTPSFGGVTQRTLDGSQPEWEAIGHVEPPDGAPNVLLVLIDDVGRVIDAIDELGELDNTLVLWIWGDNGASMEGTITGSFNELTMQNGIPLTDEMQLQLAERYGGIEAWGNQMMAPHYSAAWAWAGNTPFKWGKQVGSHLGGTRNPLVVHWPESITERGALRPHFTHVTDVGPTILDIAGVPMPTHIDGIEQQPMHGATFADSLTDADAPERHTQQYFETIGKGCQVTKSGSSPWRRRN